MRRELYTNVVIGGNVIPVTSVEVSEGYKQTTSRFSIELADITGIQLNQTVSIDLGYKDDHAVIFEGYLDEIAESRMPGSYSLEGRDVLKRAIEHFIVTTDLENPWCRSSISAEDLVRDLLREAGIYDYSGAVSSFTFGVSNPAEFNLMSSWDGVSLICSILAYNCYAKNGTVYFKRVMPVPGPTYILSLTVGDAGNLERITYSYNTDNLRNKVVVFGKQPIYAESSVASPYLPAGFYKTAIVSSEMIETQSMADQSAEYNLELYNKLTESIQVTVEGNHRVRCMDTIRLDEPFTGRLDERWFVYAVSHRVDDSGYKMNLSLSR